jgi:hypothetical protein
MTQSVTVCLSALHNMDAPPNHVECCMLNIGRDLGVSHGTATDEVIE